MGIQMHNPGAKFPSGKTRISLLLLLGLLFVSFVAAEIYQAATGSGSLAEVGRNVNLADGESGGFSERPALSGLTFQAVQQQYSALNDARWREYALSILGSRVAWSGKVSSIETGRVEIDLGTAPLRYLVLIGVPAAEKERLSIGDSLAFEGRLQSFHWIKGMNPVLDDVQIK